MLVKIVFDKNKYSYFRSRNAYIFHICSVLTLHMLTHHTSTLQELQDHDVKGNILTSKAILIDRVHN